MPTALTPLTQAARDAAAAIIEARDKGIVSTEFEAVIDPDNTIGAAHTSALSGLNRAAVEELHNKGHIWIINPNNNRFTVRLMPRLSAEAPAPYIVPVKVRI